VDLLPVSGRPGTQDAARHRRAGRQGRQSRRRASPVKRNRFIALDGAVKSVNRELAHLTIVFAALAVSRWIETVTGWSIRRFVRTARRYRTIQIQAGQHTVTAADPLPDDLRQALSAINAPAEMRTNLS
jgi:hypothetical protein